MRVAGRDPGARDRAVRRSAAPARRGAGAVHRARRRRGDRVRPARLLGPVRERLGSGGRLRHLSLLDGDRGDDRDRGRGEPDPPRRGRGVEGGAQARARSARDAALDDPPREPAHAPAGWRDDPLRGAWLLPRSREPRRPRRLHRGAGALAARGRPDTWSSRGATSELANRARCRPRACARCSTGSRPCTTR